MLKIQDLGASFEEREIPEDLKAEAEEWREKMIEDACDMDDSLMEKYLEGEELKKEDIIAALR